MGLMLTSSWASKDYSIRYFGDYNLIILENDKWQYNNADILSREASEKFWVSSGT